MSHAPVKLLVSVRDRRDALAALAGGADLIDVKEPRRGPLGRADADVIRDVIDAVRTAGRIVPLSAALGELAEISELLDRGDRSGSDDALPAGLMFAKLGLSGQRDLRDWMARWVRVRQRLDDQRADQPLRWIAVIYADYLAAHAPDPATVIDAALDTGCAGVLFDTFAKRNGTLLDVMPRAVLDKHLQAARDGGLLRAIAGGLTPALLGEMNSLDVDIIAVRGAACDGGNRNGEVCPQAVARLKAAIDNRRSHTEHTLDVSRRMVDILTGT